MSTRPTLALTATWALLISPCIASDRFPLYWVAPSGEGFKAAAGDVNGDGMGDVLLVSTTVVSPSSPQEAFVRSGRNGSLLHSWTPSLPGFWAFSTFYVDPAGDLNLDGFGDIALAIGGSVLATMVEVRSGYDGSVMTIIPPPVVSNASVIGFTIAGVGDMDGDGWPQLLIRGDYFLPACSLGHGVYDFEAPGFGLPSFVTTWQCGQEFGNRIGPVDDVDGDGLPDFYVGAPATDFGGAVEAGWIGIFSGVTGSLISSLSGTTTFEFLGGNVAALSDVNGDGTPEMALTNVGGVPGITVLSLPAFTPVFTTLPGGELDTLGDADGDGIDDLLVRGANYPPISEYITAISGATGTLIGTVGQGLPWSFMSPWGALGDVNGDGLGDFAASPSIYPGTVLPPFAAQSLWTPWTWPVGSGVPLGSVAHVYVSRNFDLVNAPAVGGTAQFQVVAPKRAGKLFQVVFSQDFVFPGIPLGPFLFPVAMDGAFWASLSLGIGGALDATGHGGVTLPIPNDPALHGAVVQASGVVYDPAGPLGIGCVLTQLPVWIQ